MRKRNVLFSTSARTSLAAALVASLPFAAVAQDVKLTSTDGTVAINGTLLSFEDGFYTIRSSLGTMRVSSEFITCEGEACPKPPEPEGIVIAGSDTLGEGLMPLLLTGFAGSKNGIADVKQEGQGVMMASLTADSGFGDPIGEFIVRSSTSGEGFQALRDRDTQIGMSSRRILPAEARQLRDAGAGNMIDFAQEHVVAVDSIAVIVNQSNPINSISLETLDRIYSGQITNWSELGGQNAPINVVSLQDGSGTKSVFENRIFAQSGRATADIVTVVDGNASMAAAVNSDPNAIGYAGFAFIRGAKSLEIVGTCGISSQLNAFSAKTEEYPLQRRLYLYNRGDNIASTTKDFIDFAVSEAADGVIAKSGFVDLGVARIAQNAGDGRMKDIVTSTTDPFEFGLMREILVEMFQWDRLSTTFRFASGSSQLDGKAQRDLQRLINYLQQQPEGTEVALVGFTDGDGAFEANRALSLVRAQQVAAAIDQIAGPQVEDINFVAKGFGELAPAACNDTLDGKRINRRVEIWIRRPA